MDNKNNVEAFNAIASEQIELLFDLLIEAPREDFKDFIRYSTHLMEEFRYLYGYLQGAKEALNVRSDEMDERIGDIIDLLGDWL